MKNEINNTSKPVLQLDAQSSEDNDSNVIQDNASLKRRRSLLKGLGAAPLVMTLHSGAAMAASSNMGDCVGKRGADPQGCVSQENHDNFLRTKVDRSGKVEGWSHDIKHPYYDNQNNDENLCLVSVDADGNIHIDRVKEDRVVATSCWTSFV
jgi:hypothetical protein